MSNSMYVVDANILIYSFRKDSDFHQVCYDWLTKQLAAGVTLAVPDVNHLALVRLMTLPSLGEQSAHIDDVFAFIHTLHRLENYRTLGLTTKTLHYWHTICTKYQLRGNHVNDAYLAALAMEHHATLVSADKGFARFKELTWFNPLIE